MKIITIAGTVGKDAVLRRTQKDEPILGFSVAVDDGYGQNKSTLWFDASIFGKRGEALAPHLKKGTKITASGSLGTREHEGKTYLTVNVQEVALQGGKPEGQREERQSYAQASSGSGNFAAAMDDDIPFACEWR